MISLPATMQLSFRSLALSLVVVAVSPAARAQDPQPRRQVYDLLALAPFADHDGSIRLGTGLRTAIAIVGGFNTGFSLDGAGVLRGHGNEAELVVDLRGGTTYRVDAEVTPRRTRRLSLFADGRRVGRVRLRRGRQRVSFTLPADRVRDGENYLTFHLRGWRRARGRLFRGRRWLRKPRPERVRLTFHRIEITPERVPAQRVQATPVYLPRGAVLSGRLAGTGSVAVRVRPAGGTAEELFTRRVDGAADVEVDLSRFGGRVVEVSLVSQDTAAWREARIVAPAPSAAPPVKLTRPRNVVLWVIDTLRADKLRCYNPDTRVRTPNFDAFAARGVLFHKAIAQSSHSKPAAATILTGHYPSSHGARRYRDRVSRRIPLLSQLFRRAGYHTAAFAANGYIGAKHGFRRGWDKFRNPLREGRPGKTPYLFPLVRRWLTRPARREKPFFLYVQTIDPHVPYNPPRQFLAPYWKGRYRGRLIPRRSGHQLDAVRGGKLRLGPRDRRYAEALYDAEVAVADYYFGKLLDLLDRQGLARDTLVVVTADHGEEFWEHGNPGHGHTVYNELTGVPLLFGPAPLTPAGRVVASDVEIVDLAPTILDLVGLEVPAAVQGRSLTPLFGAEPLVPGPAFSNHEERIASAQVGRWKYILYRGGAQRVFDLQRDPHEQRNLASQRPVVRRYLRGLLAGWLHQRAHWRKRRDGLIGRPGPLPAPGSPTR